MNEIRTVTGICLDCNKVFNKGWIHPNAKRHAKSTGHTVVVDIAYKYKTDEE